MKIFSWILHSVFTTYCTDTEGQPFQGVVQGSEVAQALWLIISIYLVQCLQSKNLTTQIYTPISKVILLLATLTFVNDTDLHVLNLGSDTTEEVVRKA